MTIFTAPSTCPPMATAPDHIPISEFMLSEKFGRAKISESLAPYICGLTGKQYSHAEVAERTELLARGLKKELGVNDINKGGIEKGFDEWEKVVGIFSVNCVDYITASWAVQRLNGVASPANAAYPEGELTYQLKDSKSKILFTCASLLDVAIPACKASGIPLSKIFLFAIPDVLVTKEAKELAKGFRTLDDLIDDGKKLPAVEKSVWKAGYGRKKIAYLCYSSGTSGLPKGVMIAHHNLITNIKQISTWGSTYRDYSHKMTILALLPQSHIYGLVVISHTEPYLGNSAVILPKFELTSFLEAIQKYKMEYLFLVPPIMITLVKNYQKVREYDFSTVRYVMTGAAPMTEEMSHEMLKLYPDIAVCQGYGMTESCTVVSSTSSEDIVHGSSGCVMPNTQCRIVNPEGESLGEGELGELLVKNDAVVPGYYNNPKANEETFQDGWLRTGDEAVFRKSEKGNMHLFVVDRLKDLVKVNGHQVAPAELEGHLLNHPSVADCAVIPVADERAGEYPKAFVVLNPGVEANEETVNVLKKWVADHKASYKRLGGGVEFIDMIPKSPSGKILRRMLRDQEREKRRKEGPKL